MCTKKRARAVKLERSNRLATAFIAAFFCLVSSSVVLAEKNAACLGCHGRKGPGVPYVDARSFSKSIHGRNLCTACHADATGLPHGDKLAPVACGRCHRIEAQIYLNSDHGLAIAKGRLEAASCKDCHGHSHTLLNSRNPLSPVHRKNIPATCARCHENAKRVGRARLTERHPVVSYNQTVHGAAFSEGMLNAAVCTDCHGTHDLHGSANPAGRVYKNHIPETCGLSAVKSFYWILIALVIGFMLIHNGLDLLRKMISGAPRLWHEEEAEIRLTVNERWQHGILIVTFLLLAYSGFALKFPEAGWAKIFAPFIEETRRSLHRWTALFFCILGAYHLLHLAFKRRGRQVLKALKPGWGDLAALGQHFAYALGWRRRPAERHGLYEYPEKLEYWALAWDSIVMIATGGLLVFNNFSLKHFPLWMAELATAVHFYEALLACLAVLVWHFYLVIFDPKVYPMNWAWLTGFIRRRSKPTH